MDKNNVLDIIINFIKGIKTNNQICSNFAQSEVLEINNCGYLLSQILRHYQIPASQYFVSEKAFELWSKISTDSIFNYTYRDKVKKNVNGSILVDKYKGGEKFPHKKDCEIKCGETLIFNDIFIDEHVVPINIIIKNLLELQNLDYVSVKNVLDKISICKLLKEEDRRIVNKSNRSIDYKEVFNTDYLEAGIKVKDFVYDKKFSKHAVQKPLVVKNTIIKKKNGGKSMKRCYQEEFTFINVRKIYRGKDGFVALNSKSQEIGIVFKGDDKRGPSYLHCELCIYESFEKVYGEWHRIKSHGARIKWEELCEKLNTYKTYKLFID